MRRILRPGPLLRDLFDRLSVRLMILMSAALLPLGAIAIGTTVQLSRASERVGERHLVALAADAMAGERALVESALASARALPPLVLERLAAGEDCDGFLGSYVARSSLYSHITFIAPDGSTACSSSGERLTFGESPAFRNLLERPRTVINAVPAGRASGIPVVIVTRPVFDDRTLAGFVSVSIAQASMDAIGRRVVEDAPTAAILMNELGVVISQANDSPRMADMPSPERLAELAAEGGSAVVRERTREGDVAVFAVSELIPQRLFAVAMWEDGAPEVAALAPARLPLLFPAAMWLASLAVVLLSIHYLVLRHLRQINRQVRRFAIGQRDVPADLPAPAPVELREVQSTFGKMARIIARDEEEREQALHEKTVLLKELHHRVKNNLQLIASIINLQLRQIDDREARRVLRAVQERVLGLATVHRALYDEHQLDQVRADRVMEEILRRVAGIGSVPGSGTRLELSLEPILLDADRLVPLSFVATEAVTNALKHGNGPGGGQGLWIGVELAREGTGADAPGGKDLVVLRVRNTLPKPAPFPAGAGGAADGPAGEQPDWDRSGDGLGSELLEAFAMQLDGDVVSGPAEHPDHGPIWQVALRFPLPPGLGERTATRPAVEGQGPSDPAGRPPMETTSGHAAPHG
ncbi:MAG: sensor histidine kinase [Rubellimicrobium sp.]|nr:sensor histidine kinase [Rubellimicrobium sp.]